MSHTPKTVLVTVGSTLFADLTNAVFEPAFIHALIVSGFTRLVVQYGSATLPSHAQNLDIPGISVEVKPYISDIDNAISQSDLIISHAGAGSIMSGLRKGKEMVVVPNTKLMDNHQVELAEVLQREGYLLMSTVEDLPNAILVPLQPTTFTPFPEFKPARFRQLVDDLF